MVNAVWYRKLANILILFFLLNVIDSIMEMLRRTIQAVCTIDMEIYYLEYLIMSLLTYGALSLVLANKFRIKKLIENAVKVVCKKIYYLVLFMAITMVLTIASLYYAERYVANERFTIIVIALCALAFVGIGILGMFVIYIRNTNIKIEEMLENEKQQKIMQKQYYEALLEKEEDTRRYRHDMANHMLCLNGLAQQDNMEELKAYLQKMQEQTQVIQRKHYTTGNQVLDVITNYYVDSLENVNVKVAGQVSPSLSIDSVSLCTIYANLLKNAFEELARKDEDRNLNINFQQGVEYFQLKIQNSLSEESRKKKNLLATKKTDKRNHGIGLRNVYKAVEECGGKIKFNYDDTVFEVEVILPTNDHSRS